MHPRTYSLTASGPNGELFLVTDDESGIQIGHAKLIGGPLTAPRQCYQHSYGRVLNVRSPEFRQAVQEVFDAPGEWGPAQGYYGGHISHFIDMLDARLGKGTARE